MPYARNALDGSRVYFEDDGGDGAAVVLHGGLLESVDLVRASHIARARYFSDGLSRQPGEQVLGAVSARRIHPGFIAALYARAVFISEAPVVSRSRSERRSREHP